MDSALIEQIRQQYSRAAREAIQKEFSQLTVLGACCGGAGDDGACCSTERSESGSGQRFGSALYPPAMLATVPAISVSVSSGCGDPVTLAAPEPGEMVLDLGCGGGLDVFLAAMLVGDEGKAFGLEMTDQMLALANSSKRAAGVGNVEFLYGYMESIPLPAASVDVVLANRSINLSSEKDVVFAEIARVLRPGGRLAVADVLASDDLAPPQRLERVASLDCLAGVLSAEELRDGLKMAGLDDVEVRTVREIVPQIFTAQITARR